MTYYVDIQLFIKLYFLKKISTIYYKMLIIQNIGLLGYVKVKILPCFYF